MGSVNMPKIVFTNHVIPWLHNKLERRLKLMRILMDVEPQNSIWYQDIEKIVVMI